MLTKFKSEVDVAVLLLFFTRTDITIRTFTQIRKARPSRLYLFQDGPRPGRKDDIVNIKQCREAVEAMIDWDCEIHRNYQEKNLGCDPSEYISQKWMFSTEDKGIIIEDDDVMSVSFFRYCKELLDKYESDTRINVICGMNHLGVYEDCPYDYFFTRQGGAIWGWATWKRCVDQWDPTYAFTKDPYSVMCMDAEFGRDYNSAYLETVNRHAASGREHYESILGAYARTNNTVNIVPKRNMTCNIGIGVETTHSVSGLHLLPRSIRRFIYMRTYEIEFPMKHPSYVQADYNFARKFKKTFFGSKISQILQLRRMEGIIYRIFPAIGKITLKYEKKN